MKFSISREALLKSLQIAFTAVESRSSTLPILSHVFIRLESLTELTMIGTNLEVEQRISVTEGLSVHDMTDPATTVPAKKLLDMCRALPESSVLDFSTEGDGLHVKSGKSKFKLSTLSASDYPNMDNFEPLVKGEISAKALLKGLQATAFSMADNDVRYYLNGMYLEFHTNELNLVSTDGHRLSMYRMELDTPIALGKDIPSMGVIIPKKPVLNIIKFLDEKGADFTVSVAFNQNFLQLAFGNQIMNTKLIDGRFPDYRRVIPKTSQITQTTQRAELQSAVQRVSILSNSRYRGGEFHFNKDHIECSARNEEHEGALEMISSTSLSGGDLMIGFNLGYVLDVLGAMKCEKILISLSDANSSATIVSNDHPDGALYVLMPMRL